YQKTSLPENRFSGGRAEDITKKVSSNVRLQDNRNTLCWNRSAAKFAQCTQRGSLANLLRTIHLGELATDIVPVVALHFSVFGGYGHRRQRAGCRPEFASE